MIRKPIFVDYYNLEARKKSAKYKQEIEDYIQSHLEKGIKMTKILDYWVVGDFAGKFEYTESCAVIPWVLFRNQVVNELTESDAHDVVYALRNACKHKMN